MAKVSLRNYNREIEGFIDQNRLDEAIAHCRHILQTYPKHLDTYRLLGKAYLEAKRYDEAVDVFTRVLASVPDDFVAHVGMSIIRDEQGRLDEAISHMERAYETQPSNPAIQNELRRLFGRRDGVQPTKIRMKRDALAHMYVQGELYPQAIAEIKAVLATDSQRTDMKTLLARAYFHAGQKADASDLCAQLLETYAYSLDANRIMSELMQGAEGKDAGAAYRERVIELDPYAAYSPAGVFHPNEAPEVSVSLDHLEYHGQDMEAAPEWKPAGIGEPAPDEQPEWLKRDYSSGAEEPPAPKLESKNDLPDFMRAAGWTAATGIVDESAPVDFGKEETQPADLAPGDMPDWLKAMAPAEEPEETPVIPIPPAEQLRAGDIPDWLSDVTPRDSLTPPPAPAAEPPAEIPDWLQDVSAKEPETPIPAAVPTPAEELPDWLSGMTTPEEAEAQAAAEIPVVPTESAPVWMADMASAEAETPAAPVEAIEPVAEAADDTPDWLKKLTAEAETPTPEIPDWLENIEAAEPGMAPSSAEAALPDWLASTPQEPVAAAPIPEPEPMEQEFPPMITPVEPLTPPPSLESLGTSMKEQDDALAWLESLAAKHGAKAEELVSDPNARTDKPPEWVQQARALSEGQPVTPEPSLEETQPVFLEPEPEQSEEREQPVEPAKPVVEAVEPEVPFLEPLEPVVPELEGALHFEEAETAQMIEPEPEHPEPAVPAEVEPILEPFTPGAFTTAADETGIWLRSLDEKESAAETTGVSADFIESLEQAEDWVKTPEAVEPPVEVTPQAEITPQAEMTPPVMEEAPVEAPVEAVPAAASDLPDWLQDIDREEEPWTAAPVSETLDEEIPAWLQGEAEPAPEAEPTVPGEWRRAETVQEPEMEPAEMESVPLAVTPEEEIPAWLRGEAAVEPETPAAVEAAPEPSQEYLQELEELREQPLAVEPVEMEREPEPVEPARMEIEAEQEVEPELQQEAQMEAPHYEEPVREPEAEAEPEPEPPMPVVSRPVEPPPAPRKPPVRPAERKPAAGFPSGEPALALARAEMNRGDIPSALEQYGRLIRRGKYLEEIIHDMREALYRYPVEVTVWQTLGDAYMRENRLQEALDAYTKAEELLR